MDIPLIAEGTEPLTPQNFTFIVLLKELFLKSKLSIK
jgi:hypothetical protein